MVYILLFQQAPPPTFAARSLAQFQAMFSQCIICWHIQRPSSVEDIGEREEEPSNVSKLVLGRLFPPVPAFVLVLATDVKLVRAACMRCTESSVHY